MTPTASTTPDHFDLVIIGGGSGNSIPSPALRELKIALVDDGRWFGGTCLNAGCIPTKMFVHPGEVVADARNGGHLGVRGAGELRLDWDSVRDRTFGRTDAISAGGEEYRAHGEPNISLIREHVEFTGRDDEGFFITTSSGRVIHAAQVVIGAGSRPRELTAVPFGGRVISSDDALRLDARPERIVIIGGGVIASEFAAIFTAFGSQVTQVVRRHLLGEGDLDVTAVAEALAAEQWDLRLGVEATGMDERAEAVSLALSDGTRVEAEFVLVAAGRIPNSDRLGLETLGVDLHDDGRVRVDAMQRVLVSGEPVRGLWAFGDIDSKLQLKHVANQEARNVAENLRRTLAGEELVENTLAPVPAAVFGSPESATFGATLESARDAGADAFEVTLPYGATAWGWALDDDSSFAKLIVDRTDGQILGAHLIGPLAPSLIQPLVMAASHKLPVQGLARSMYWPHPAPTEVIENVLLRAEEELAK